VTALDFGYRPPIAAPKTDEVQAVEITGAMMLCISVVWCATISNL